MTDPERIVFLEAAEPGGQDWFVLVEIFTAELKAHVDEIPPSAPARQ
jgi:hypothetical protein